MNFPFAIDHLRLSHSTLQSKRSCPRKLEFAKFYGHHAYEESLPAGVGTALHAGFQHYLMTGDKKAAIGQMLLTYPFGNWKTPTLLQERSIEACYATLIEMFNHPLLGESEIAQFETTAGLRPAIEVPFQINFSNFSLSDSKLIPVFYVGFMDFILYNYITDEYVVVDIKSHRILANDLTAKYMFDEQCLPYAIVLERLLGKPLNSLKVIYFSVFIDIEEPKVRKYELNKTRQDIEDWARSIYFELLEIKTWANLGWFPQYGGSCMNFNRPCSRAQYCASRDQELIKQMLDLSGETKEEMPIDPWVTLDLELGLPGD